MTFFEIMEYARKKFIAVSLVTNGILMTEEIARKLDVLHLDTITVSIDGLEKNHDYIRGAGTFKKTVGGIKILRKYCHTAKLAIRVTVNKLNIDECEKLIKMAEELRLDLIRLTPILLLGRAKKNRELLLSQDQYISFLNEVKKIESAIKIVLPHQENKAKFFISQENFGCHCGQEACWITQTGDYYPCIFFGDDFKAGNIKIDDYLDLWEKLKDMVKLCGNPICNKCADYKKCRGGCRARALWEYQDINAVDPLCPLKRNFIKQ